MELIYKYYPFEAGLKALRSRTLGFNTPKNFNDPMEGRLWLHKMGVEPGFLDGYLPSIGILCLSSDPLNPLMWSHYGQSHTGFVIGYDVNDPIFGNQKDCVFGISEGEVLYSSQFETDTPGDDALEALKWMAFGGEEPCEPQVKQGLRHILLLKQTCWSYEEEIRIIKLITNLGEDQHGWASITGNHFKTISTLVAPMVSVSESSLHLLEIDSASIKRIILGMKNPILKNHEKICPDPILIDMVETQGLRVEKTEWAPDGYSMIAVTAKDANLGYMEEIRYKKIDHRELDAISVKLSAPRDEKQGLTLTKFPHRKIEAFWDDELQ